ncbi:MAG: efflux RND transporter periplasmic adaptor subunit [Candidatus Cloacimonetes bacterium]|nr:efflux RND transporter periplasmic adaptor subunit [Candidatus Cloacimonadota bacterium]MBS3767246.1 efflux RND transporter periplasmic adaptor subunit [Candidatus Cloacimonadota bacterium]
MRKYFWIIIGLVIIIVLFFILKPGKETKQQSMGKIQKSPTAVVNKGNIEIVLDEVGVIEPVKEVNVKSKISGKIKKMFVDEGDYVEENQEIAIIEPDMQQAQTLSRIKSNLKTARIDLNTAEIDYKAKKKLYEKELISKNEWIDAQNALEKAEINYESALEQFNLVKDQGITGDDMKVIAPSSGTIIEKKVEVGEMVESSESYSGGTVLINIADLSKMIILSEINEIDIGKIKEGGAVDISIDAYPEKNYHGKIIHIAPMAKIGNNEIRVFNVKISIDNLGKELKPGMSANITIKGKSKQNVLTVPIQAIFNDDTGNNVVYKLKNDTTYTPQIVKTGINDLQKVEVIEGIAEGDTISLVDKRKTERPDNRRRWH